MAWTRAFASAAERFPDAEFRMIVWPRRLDGPVVLRLRRPAEWHPNGRTAVAVSATGDILWSHDATAAALGDRVLYTAYPLHAAKVGGVVYKMLAALAGLALTLLSAYGTISYARHLLRPAMPEGLKRAAARSAGRGGAHGPR